MRKISKQWETSWEPFDRLPFTTFITPKDLAGSICNKLLPKPSHAKWENRHPTKGYFFCVLCLFIYLNWEQEVFQMSVFHPNILHQTHINYTEDDFLVTNTPSSSPQSLYYSFPFCCHSKTLSVIITRSELPQALKTSLLICPCLLLLSSIDHQLIKQIKIHAEFLTVLHNNRC